MKRGKYIYSEWTLYGEFYSGLFETWNEFHAATFNPDTEILVIRKVF